MATSSRRLDCVVETFCSVDTCICTFTMSIPLANFEGVNLNYSFLHLYYDAYVCLSAANYLSDQLVLQVLLNPLYVQLCFQPMHVSTVTPEYFGCNDSADEPVVL